MERNLRSKKKICLQEERTLRYDKKYSTNDGSTIEVLNDDCLVHVFEYLPFSDRIRFERVNKRWCTASRRSWKSVRTLNFTRRLWGSQAVITKKALKDVLYLCGENLTTWDMSEFSVLRSENIYFESVLQLCPNLTSVDFTSIKVRPALIQSLVRNCKNIVILKLALTTGSPLTFFTNGTVLSTYTNLQILHIKSFHERKISHREFYISLRGDWIKFNNSNSIKELRLDYCRGLDQSNLFSVVPQLSNLHTLSLRGSLNFMSISQNLDFIQLSNIKVLNISNNPNRVNNYFLLENASTFARLTSLNISGNYQVSDDGLNAVSCNLEYLNIDTLIINGSSLSGLPHLKGLSCRGCPFLEIEHMSSFLTTSDSLGSLDLRGVDNQPNLINTVVKCIESRKNCIKLRIYVDTIPNIKNIPDDLKLIKLAMDEEISDLTF